MSLIKLAQEKIAKIQSLDASFKFRLGAVMAVPATYESKSPGQRIIRKLSGIKGKAKFQLPTIGYGTGERLAMEMFHYSKVERSYLINRENKGIDYV